MTCFEFMGVLFVVRQCDVAFDVAREALIARRAEAIVRTITRFVAKKDQNPSFPIRSVGTRRAVASSLLMFGRFLEANRLGHLGAVPQHACCIYLRARAVFVSPAQLRKDHMALEFVYGKIPPVAAQRKSEAPARAVSQDQVEKIASRQTDRNAFSTRIAFATGVRAAELLTIARPSDRPASARAWSADLHAGKADGRFYTVKGKGGLVRSIWIPAEMARQLESLRRPRPVTVRNQGADLVSFYDIAGGCAWSTSFSKTAKRVFGASPGGHGTRHGYVEARRAVLLRTMSAHDVNAVLSNELGHFRSEIVPQYYSRGPWLPRTPRQRNQGPKP